MIWSAVIGLASTIFSGVKDSLDQKRQIKAAAAENIVRLLKDEQSNNHAWEMANLQDKDKGLRWLSFILFTFPLIWAGVDPAGAQEYFNNVIAALPEWYQQIVFAMVGGIWGISALKNVVPSVVGETIKTITKDSK